MISERCATACQLHHAGIRQFFDYKPERLVVSGFRCCMAAYEFGDPACWETAWRDQIEEIGASSARALMGELQFWVRTIRANSNRDIQLFPYGCRHVCADECMALSLVAAMQCQHEASANLAATCLLGNAAKEKLAQTCAAARSYGAALHAHGLRLIPVSPLMVQSIAAAKIYAPSRSLQ
jgi:hypothetical protein